MTKEKQPIIFCEGIFVKSPFDNLIKLSIDEEKFVDFILTNSKEVKKKDGSTGKYLNIDIRKSKNSDKWYACVDNWKKPE